LPVLEGVHVLLVEDDAATRWAITRVLEEAGAQVTAVPSAAQALTTLEAALEGPGTRPDVLLSDIGMVDVDGYELLRRVRAMEARGGHRPLRAAALTAYARDQDRNRALEAGFQAHLAKPVEPTAVIRTVANLAGRF
jgi:CheY-like chemotaxis protein